MLNFAVLLSCSLRVWYIVFFSIYFESIYRSSFYYCQHPSLNSVEFCALAFWTPSLQNWTISMHSFLMVNFFYLRILVIFRFCKKHSQHFNFFNYLFFGTIYNLILITQILRFLSHLKFYFHITFSMIKCYYYYPIIIHFLDILNMNVRAFSFSFL